MNIFISNLVEYAWEMRKSLRVIHYSHLANAQDQWELYIWNVSNNGLKAKKFKELEKPFLHFSGKI
jgi:hypothetical protein